MFKRFIDVYGKEFQPLLGDKQYITDPFWERVLPKEDEIRVIRAQEKTDQRASVGKREADKMDIERKNTGGKNHNRKLEVVSIIKDSFEVQRL